MFSFTISLWYFTTYFVYLTKWILLWWWWCCKRLMPRICRIVEEKVLLGDFPSRCVDGDNRIAHLAGPAFHHCGNINVTRILIHSLQMGHKLGWQFMKSTSQSGLPSWNLKALPSACIPRVPSLQHFYSAGPTDTSERGNPKREQEFEEESCYFKTVLKVGQRASVMKVLMVKKKSFAECQSLS